MGFLKSLYCPTLLYTPGLYEWEILTTRAAKILTARPPTKDRGGDEDGVKDKDIGSSPTSRIALDQWVALNSFRAEQRCLRTPTGRNSQECRREAGTGVVGGGKDCDPGGGVERQHISEHRSLSCCSDGRKNESGLRDDEDTKNEMHESRGGGSDGTNREGHLTEPRPVTYEDDKDTTTSPFSWLPAGSFKAFLLTSLKGVFSASDEPTNTSLLPILGEEKGDFLYSYQAIPTTPLRTTRTSPTRTTRGAGPIPPHPDLFKADADKEAVPSLYSECPCEANKGFLNTDTKIEEKKEESKTLDLLLLSTRETRACSLRGENLDFLSSICPYSPYSCDNQTDEKEILKGETITSPTSRPKTGVPRSPPAQFVPGGRPPREADQKQQEISFYPVPPSSFPSYLKELSSAFSLQPQCPTSPFLLLPTYRTTSSSSSLSRSQESQRGLLVSTARRAGRWPTAATVFSTATQSVEKGTSFSSGPQLSGEVEHGKGDEDDNTHDAPATNRITVRFKDKPFQKPSFVPSLDLKKCLNEKKAVPA